MSRQIGTALGVAMLVAIIGDSRSPASIEQFRFAYFAMGLIALGSGVACLALKKGILVAIK